MSSFLDQVLQGVKRTPGIIAGAPVDVANLVAGLAAGRGLNGLVDTPVSGSKQLNAIFGLDTPSGGVAQDSVEAVTGLLSPGGAAKVVAGGMIVPARLLGDKSMKTMMEFVRAESLGTKTAKELYDQTGIYRGQLDTKKLKGIIGDSGAKFIQGGAFRKNGSLYEIAQGTNDTVASLLDHPKLMELIKKDPELAKIADYKIIAEPPGSNAFGSFNPNTNEISLAARGSEKDLMSTLLHEVQHAIQYRTGQIPGGNPGMFVEYPGRVQRALTNASAAQIRLGKELTAAVTGSAEEAKLIKQIQQLTQDRQTLQGINQKAYRTYLELQGETDARVTQRMFADPREIKAFDPAYPDPASKVKASDLKNPNDAFAKFDLIPGIKDLVDQYQTP